PSPLRAEGLAGAEGHRALLDRLVRAGAGGPHDPQGALMRVTVVGAGRSGLAVARFCAARGDEVLLTDRNPDPIAPGAVPESVRLELGGHRAASFTGADLVVVSPGVPDIPELRAARAAGVKVIGEIELAGQNLRAPVVAITGTNGKSTTTALAGAI